MKRALLLLVLASRAQAAEAPLAFDQYLVQVARSNPTLTAQRLTLPIAEAQVVLARVFPDPVLTAGLASLDLSDVGAQNNVAASLSVPLEWPGKRSGRVALAEANLSVAAADFEDFARTVRVVAALAYIDAVSTRRVYERKKTAAQSLARVVELNEQRLKEGAASEIAVLQARVEARRAEGELVTASADVRASRLALQEQMGGPLSAPPDGLAPVQDELQVPLRTVDVAQLVSQALQRRPDLRARERGIAAAAAQLQLAKANRGPDVSVGLGWLSYTAGATGSAYQGPPYHTLSALLSAPLPFSKLYDGEVRAATAQQALAAGQRDAAAVRVEAEVRASVIRYEAARARLAQFDEALLSDGDRLLAMARYAYEQGAARLVELLSAQRSWVDLHLTYEAALADHARAALVLDATVGAR